MGTTDFVHVVKDVKETGESRARDLGERLTERVPLAVWMVLPAQAVLLFLVLVPALISIYLSLTGWQPTLGVEWWNAELTWFANYVELAQDGEFIYSMAFTIGILVAAVSIEFVIGFGLALLCQGEFFGKKAFVLALLTPLMVMPVVSGNTFYMFFRSDGLVNSTLTVLLGHPVTIQWLSEFPIAVVPILLADIWHWYPLMFLIMLSGMSNLPTDQKRAAELLGASRLQIFRYVSYPYLKPVILIAIVIRSMGAIKMFDVIMLTTRGGPASLTQNVSVYINELTFDLFRTGYASTAAWVVFLISVIVFSLALRPLLYELEDEPVEDEDQADTRGVGG